eukprot:scaffold6986_cov66-Phaeocystis_antarctica.AAC.1
MAQRDQRGSLSPRLTSTPHFGAPPLIYHPCQCRASAAAPGRVNECCVSLSDVRESVPHCRSGASSHTLPVDDWP